MKKILLENLTFGYNKNELLFDKVSLELSCEKNSGIVYALMGESGSGKTTLLKLFLGIENALVGQVTLLPKNSILSYVPQDPVLFDHLTPIESASYFKMASNLKQHFNQDTFNKVAESLDLEKVFNSKIKIRELSGGQKQRISLLRALSIRPDILFLDEPCNGLDQEVKLSFLMKLRQITESLGIMVIYITHHYDEAKYISDQICYLVKEGETGIIRHITKQSFEEFVNLPPSISALAMMNFPDNNIIKVEESSDSFSLGNEAKCFLYLAKENFVFTENEGATFIKVLQSGKFSTYKHNTTENFIVLDKQLMDKDIFNLQIKGTLLSYNSEGIYIGKKESKSLK